MCPKIICVYYIIYIYNCLVSLTIIAVTALFHNLLPMVIFNLSCECIMMYHHPGPRLRQYVAPPVHPCGMCIKISAVELDIVA